ncbi:MAG: helix-turn-helix transcriptional regulator [Actinomycetota bacterium]|nr:helix-turn-helix transcriptional regulator [Actinomycetota bacterium]
MIEGELGTFLRSRREAMSPADVGLPQGSRRRTPGLRRAELATLAGVSVDYLIRLEQGRDTHPSAQVLASLADVLQLGDDDLGYLRRLSAITNGTELCPQSAPTTRTVRPTVRAMLEQLEPAPAFVINHLSDLLAWTDGYDRLARPLGILDDDEPNLLSFTFADERARDAYADWHDIADEQVADLHAQHYGDTDTQAFADHLASIAGAAFTDRWTRVAVARKPTGIRALVHPEVGLLRLAFETLELPGADRQSLVVYLAADAATLAGLDRLIGREPGALRSVAAL